MKNFMILGSLTWGIELNEVPDKSDKMPFPGEAAVMMIYSGHPPPTTTTREAPCI
jgi:hypothetical protein